MDASESFVALRMSLQIAGMATALACATGIPLAYVLSRRTFWGKSIVEGLLLTPIVLPPTVIGYLLLYVLGRNGVLGAMTGGMSLLFTQWGAVVACLVVELPLIVLPARAAFQTISHELYEDAALLGICRWQYLLHVALPLGMPGILGGVLLGFGRALGEFGATLMIVGTGEDVRTIPIQIYLDVSTSSRLLDAAPLVGALVMLSLVIAFVANRLTALHSGAPVRVVSSGAAWRSKSSNVAE